MNRKEITVGLAALLPAILFMHLVGQARELDALSKGSEARENIVAIAAERLSPSAQKIALSRPLGTCRSGWTAVEQADGLWKFSCGVSK